MTYFDTFGIATVVAVCIVSVIDFFICKSIKYVNWEKAINTYKIIFLLVAAVVAIALYGADVFYYSASWIDDTNHVNVAITAVLAILTLEEGAKSYLKPE